MSIVFTQTYLELKIGRNLSEKLLLTDDLLTEL